MKAGTQSVPAFVVMSATQEMSLTDVHHYCSSIELECAISAVGEAWLDGHRHKANIARLCIVEVVHAPVLGA